MRAPFVVASILSVAVGCSGVGGLTGGDTDGGHSPDGSAGVDAGPDVTLDATLDAAQDGGAQDSGAQDSGAQDAGRWCEHVDAAFCADFDQGNVQAGWAPFHDESSGAVTASLDLIATSNPNSGLFRAAPGYPDRATAYLSKTFTTSFSTMHLEVDLRDGEEDAAAYAGGEAADLSVKNGTAVCHVFVSPDPTNATLVFYTIANNLGTVLTSSSFPLEAAFPPGVFRRVVVDFTAGQPSTIDVAINGVPAINALAMPPECDGAPTTGEVHIGLIGLPAVADAAAVVRYDDLLVTFGN